MRRRDFFAIVGGAALSPLSSQAQQADRMRRIGWLFILGPNDPETKARLAVFEQALADLGWTIGRDVLIDVRLAAGDPERLRRYAAELVALQPEVIVTLGSITVAPLQQATRAIPIVFVNVADPVGAGFVESLARPGGNTTGFTNFEYGMSAKWVELLKQIAPRVTQVAVIRDPTSPGGTGQFGAIQSVAHSFGVELTPIGVRSPDEIERGMAAAGRAGRSGLIVTAGGTAAHRKLIIGLAARYKLPAVYPFRYYALDGGLLTYGPDTHNPVRRAAGYVDRILKGEKPAEMPVQAPTKYELVINLKTAKTLGMTVPSALLARADEVIE